MTCCSQDKCIGVIGAGTMGRGITQVFAQAGYNAYMFDTVGAALESATATIDKLLDKAVAKGKMAEDDAKAAKGRVHPVTNITELGTHPLVVEAATERLEIKIKILQEAQKHVEPGGILASNTSSISITQLAAATDHPENFVGMHFFNPFRL